MATGTSPRLEPHHSLQSSFTQTEAWTPCVGPLDANNENAGQLIIAHHALRQQLVEAQQVIERQGQKLKEKDSIIMLLTDQLDRVFGMAAAVADEVQATRRTLASAASATPYSAASPLYRGSRQGSQSASPATKGRPGRLAAGMSYKLEGSPRVAATSPDLAGQLDHQLEDSCPGLRVKVTPGLDLSGMHNWLEGAITQHGGQGRKRSAVQHTPAAAAAAAAAEALSAAEAAADDVRAAGMTGAKRLRICSNDSAVDAAAGGGVLKRAVSGGSSSSRQLVSAGDQAAPEEEEEEEVGCGAAAVRGTWQHQASPNSIMQQQLLQHFGNGVQATMDDGEQQYDDRGEEQSPDEREAASHLLAFSEAAKASSPQGQQSPTVFASSRGGVAPREGCHLVSPSVLTVVQEPWNMQRRSHIHWGAQPGLPAAPALQHILLQQAPGLVEAVAMMQTGLQAASGGALSVQPQQEASGRLLLHCGQQGPLGLAGAPDSPLYHHQQQQQQLIDDDVMADRRRRSETQDATWGPNTAAAAPVNKKSKGAWFKQEISRIPASVQQACLQHWAIHQSVRVVCNDNYGTFVVNRAGEFLVKADETGDFVSPNRFEEMAGKKTARNWQQSIRVVGHTVAGGGSGALLKLGHFTRIVGLVQQK